MESNSESGAGENLFMPRMKRQEILEAFINFGKFTVILFRHSDATAELRILR
jgi:hypothetical protein